ncbi:transmembrane protein 177-like [Asterias amurensis]|uniref:transmembrane protein 177-like n=1 Tax=Asterias amurensis TaxID=7602 RepID=UPI003AB17B8F
MVLYKFAQFVRRPRNAVIVCGMVTAGVFCIKATPHVFPAKVYRPFVVAYKGGLEMPLSTSQTSEFYEVCSRIAVNSNTYHPFVTSRWEIGSRGLAWLPNGVQFGLPAILTDDPDLSSKRFSEPIKKADKEVSESFLNALCLSESARKFAIAREIFKTKRNATAFSVLLAPAVTAVNFCGVFAAHVFVPLPLITNIPVVGVFFFILYQFMMGVTNEREDLTADEKVSQLGEEYVRGGVEFYEKTIQKNIALRKIMGRRGEKMYTYYGNETAGLTYSSGANNTQKRDKLKKKLEFITKAKAEL